MAATTAARQLLPMPGDVPEPLATLLPSCITVASPSVAGCCSAWTEAKVQTTASRPDILNVQARRGQCPTSCSPQCNACVDRCGPGHSLTSQVLMRADDLPVQGLWSALDGGGHGAPFPGEMGAWDSTKMSCGLQGCAEAVWWLRPGDYLIHKAPEDNYFIKATEYQANYRELGTWKADLADLDRFGVILPRSALLAFFPAHATLTWHHAKTCFCRRRAYSVFSWRALGWLGHPPGNPCWLRSLFLEVVSCTSGLSRRYAWGLERRTHQHDKHGPCTSWTWCDELYKNRAQGNYQQQPEGNCLAWGGEVGRLTPIFARTCTPDVPHALIAPHAPARICI